MKTLVENEESAITAKHMLDDMWERHSASLRGQTEWSLQRAWTPETATAFIEKNVEYVQLAEAKNCSIP